MILYIDINEDVHSEKVKELEKKIVNKGLLIKRSRVWTRFNNNGKHSNIDIIVYSRELHPFIEISF